VVRISTSRHEILSRFTGALAALAGTAGLLVTAGCQGQESSVQSAAKIRAIEQGPATDRMYFLGARFQGLPLTFLRPPDENGIAAAVYGSCAGPAFGEGGCAPPVSVSTVTFTVPWEMVAGCRRMTSLRGVPTVSLAGVGLFTGDPLLLIKMDVTDPKQLQAAVANLRLVAPGRRPAELPPPSATDRANIDRTCGPRPGVPGTSPQLH
jgi:hypothetical protein